MADPTMTDNNSNNANQTMQRERADSEVSGGSDGDREQNIENDKKLANKGPIGSQQQSGERANRDTKGGSTTNPGGQSNNQR